MDEGEVQSVLRCSICNKPFNKQSTLKRHGYYCRSRKTAAVNRVRSCVSCVRAKARCDNKRPTCTRCVTKSVECNYPTNATQIPASRTHTSESSSTARRKTPPLRDGDLWTPESYQSADNGNSDIDSAIATLDPSLTTLEEEYLDWFDSNAYSVDLWDPQTHEKAMLYSSSQSPSTFPYPTPSSVWKAQTEQNVALFNASIPASPDYNVRSLTKRTRLKTGGTRIANLMIHTLKSYPTMMLRYNGLPPFIHPGSISSDVGNNDVEPLTNCISLVHMISNSVRGSRKLFWKNVRLECERLCVEYLNLSKWELLAAMQALSIYTLIRLDEGETDYNNFDSLLLTTVTVLAKQLNDSKVIHETHSLRKPGPKTSWKDWIFLESARRICVIFQVVNLLVHFEPALMCDLQTDLVLAPLPARKQTWEAGDEHTWRAEIEKEAGLQTAFGLATNGDLVTLDDGQDSCNDAVVLSDAVTSRSSSGRTANWEEWCSGMDGLGSLVMLAASLLA